MRKYLMYLVLFNLLFIVGCAQVPQSVGLPWNRSLSSEKILPASKISVSVECKSTPLLGSDQLVNDEIAATVNELLTRRGFIVSEQNPKYRMKVKYQTEVTRQKVLMSSLYSSSNAGYYDSSLGYSGLGVIFALSMAAASASNTNYSQNINVEYDTYKHSLTCEIYSERDQVIWQNETFIDSYQLDILSRYIPLLQIAFSALPTTNEVVPRVEKLKSDRIADFAQTYLSHTLLMSPALPNYIKIIDPRDYNSSSNYIPRGISDPSAIMAYLDLLSTAEYAIPNGDEKDWQNPTKKSLWANAFLIGRCYLGQDETPVNVVISLKGTPNYYTVDKCRLVSDKLYQQYLYKHNAWKSALVNYYNFFEE